MENFIVRVHFERAMHFSEAVLVLFVLNHGVHCFAHHFCSVSWRDRNKLVHRRVLFLYARNCFSKVAFGSANFVTRLPGNVFVILGLCRALGRSVIAISTHFVLESVAVLLRSKILNMLSHVFSLSEEGGSSFAVSAIFRCFKLACLHKKLFSAAHRR